MPHSSPRLLGLVLAAGLSLSGCEWARQFTTAKKKAAKPTVAQAPSMILNIKLPDAKHQLVPPTRIAVQTQPVRQIEAFTRQVERSDTLLATLRRAEAEAKEAERIATEAKATEAKVEARKPKDKRAKPVKSEVGEATTALDLNKYYTSVMAMYEPDPNDSEKMREFKALRLKMDAALVKAGYTQQQIRQYYVLQFLGKPDVQPNSSPDRTPGTGS